MVFNAAAKDLKRLRQILGIIVKHGFGELIEKGDGREGADAIGDEAREALAALPDVAPPPPATGPRRFRTMLEELGPTFIKLGQVLSARPDLVSRVYVEELKKLQYQCVPVSYGDIRDALGEGLGAPPSSLFEEIDETPLATASIAQVHRAVTRDGTLVAVKVQRPGAREEIRADLDVLYRVAWLLEAVIEESALADPMGVVREFEGAINAELDFRTEANNIREFRRHHEGRDDVVIPGVHEGLSTETVLTLDFLDGIPFTRLPETADKKKIAERIVREAFDEIFLDGFFHGDPHPGNLLLLKDGRYGILDYGLCGRLTPQMRETLVVLCLAVALKDADTAARTLYRLGHAETRVSISALRDDLALLFERYLGRRIKDVESTLVLQELMTLALRHRIRIPPEYAMLGRAGGTIEGIVRELDPDIDVAKVAAPYAERLLIGRMGPDNIQGGLYRMLLQFQGLSQDVPIQVAQILSDLSAGNLSVNVRGAPVERLASTLLMAAAAISGSILGGAFVIGAFIGLARVSWEVHGFPVVALVGLLLAAIVFGWVSAYVVFRPRIKKLSVASWFQKKRPS